MSPLIYTGLKTIAKTNFKKDLKLWNKRIPTQYTSKSIKRSIEIYCMRKDLDFKKVLTRTRKREYVYLRQIWFYFEREVNGMTLTKCGRKFGFDHATVLHSVNKVKAAIEGYDPIIENMFNEVKAIKDEIALKQLR